MRQVFALMCAALAGSSGGCSWLFFAQVAAGNAYHQTVEQATAARVARRFRVLDAETGRPVAGARVVAVHNFDWMDDWSVEGAAGADGVATLKLARDYLHLLHVHVSAPGYLGREWLTFGESSPPGVGALTDDPVDLRVFKGPAPSVGLRVPEGFVGTFVYQAGQTKYDFPYPPDFPPGQRVWWTDVDPARVTVVEPPPPLGISIGQNGPGRRIVRGGEVLATPGPGANHAGVAAWVVGVREPDGAWSVVQYVVVIGDRDAAVAQARQEWERHGNGDKGFIYNGWLRLVSPRKKLNDPNNPYAVTRNLPRY